MLSTTFNLQGHRGARGLKPDNTLPSFEVALQVGASSVETDLHLTRDGQVVLCHDPTLGGRLIRDLSRDELRPFAIPTLDELFEFVKRRERTPRLVFDLELKRVPARPQRIGDGFDGGAAGLLEERVLECIHRHGVLERTVVRSFDHRSVRAIKEREPRLRTAILVAAVAPVAPEELAQRAGASIYCPEADFLDERQVRQLHKAGIAVLPWTVNDPADWERLLDWGVDGITTDYPDRLAALLRARGIPF
jgi:glycerophosphoryl diester phosphodiesterase